MPAIRCHGQCLLHGGGARSSAGSSHHWRVSARVVALVFMLLLCALALPAHAQTCASFSLSSTNSAQTGYQLCTVVLNGGYTYTFSTCGTSGTTDTFVRLWNAANTAVRSYFSSSISFLSYNHSVSNYAKLGAWLLPRTHRRLGRPGLGGPPSHA